MLSFDTHHNGCLPDQPDVITYRELGQASTFCSLCRSKILVFQDLVPQAPAASPQREEPFCYLYVAVS